MYIFTQIRCDECNQYLFKVQIRVVCGENEKICINGAYLNCSVLFPFGKTGSNYIIAKDLFWTNLVSNISTKASQTEPYLMPNW